MIGRMKGAARPVGESELHKALAAFRGAFLGAAAVSGVLNLLMLSGSFFMLLVYDSVLPSRSGASLAGLLVLVLVLYAFQGVLDFLRSRIMVQVGAAADGAMSGRVYGLVTRGEGAGAGDGLQPLRDLDQLRSFLSGPGLLALFDLPWMVLYLGVCFLFHWSIGLTALAGALILLTLTVVADRLAREPVRKAAAAASIRNGMAAADRQNAEVVKALGMRRRLADAWSQANEEHLASQQKAAGAGAGLGSLTKVLRLALQSVVLAVGAWLVLQDRATAGVIIAGSILSARALAPVELAVGNWRSVVATRQAWTRLVQALSAAPVAASPTPLPAPCKTLQVEGLSVAPPRAQRLTVQDVSFTLSAGEGLGVVGPSASGKSSLARALVGAWPTVRGKVRLDGAALEQWDDERLGRHIGYLPQDVELLAGTVAQNIARFEPGAEPDAIIAAARLARVHEMILRLPEGYETQVGPRGAALSAGQSQRVALARALYGDPFLVVLDEPNSNLDGEGEQALGEAIADARARGAIVVVIAHRPSALAAVDQMLVLRDGRVQAFGPKDEVLPKILPPPLLRPVEGGGRRGA